MVIGFIGLGNMGSGMAVNLLAWCLANGHQLVVFDINSSQVDVLASQGAGRADSIAELAQQVDIVFTSLPTHREVELVAADLFMHLPAAAVWFETSTNQLASWRALQAKSPASISMIDAPVTGGSEGAAAGTLTMLLGCDPEQLQQHDQLLGSFTAKRVCMGPSGAGYVAKLCQLHLNYLVAQGIGETLMLGAKAELSLDTLYDVLTQSCAQSYVVDNYIPRVLDGSYDPSFTLGLARKDMRLIAELGSHLDVPLELGAQVLQSYEDAVSRFGEQQPHLQIVKRLEEAAGQLLRADMPEQSK